MYPTSLSNILTKIYQIKGFTGREPQTIEG